MFGTIILLIATLLVSDLFAAGRQRRVPEGDGWVRIENKWCKKKKLPSGSQEVLLPQVHETPLLAAQGAFVVTEEFVLKDAEPVRMHTMMHPDQRLLDALSLTIPRDSFRIAAVQAALEDGADPNIVCNGGTARPLHMLALDFDQGVVLAELLCKHGAALEAKNRAGHEPLHRAVESNNYPYAEFLLKQGANVNALSRSFHTPLFFAVSMNNLKMVELLLAYGASVMVQAADGRTVFSFGRIDDDIRKLLAEHYEKEKNKEQEIEAFREKLLSKVFGNDSEGDML
ncbi:ankyrin repeat domain-containing protein [Candidatus Babeliales bacterium]|nr:ankyrin repeat domain-containing protein [Candidatus Babeliales bacterium]